jgi:hypothetical protein
MTGAQKKAVKREDEETPRYPHPKMYVRRTQAVDQTAAADAESSYATPVPASLDKIFGDMKLDAAQQKTVLSILKNAGAFNALPEAEKLRLQKNAATYNAAPEQNAALADDAARWADLSRDASVVKGCMEVTLDVNGNISAVTVADRNKAINKLKSRLGI